MEFKIMASQKRKLTAVVGPLGKARHVLAQRAFIEHLENKRQECGLSYQALSDACSVNVATVHEMLTEKTKAPSWLHVAAVAQALGLHFNLADERGRTVVPHPSLD